MGGAIRDALLGRPTNDFDLASNAPVDEARRLFPNSIPTGIKYGTISVRDNGSSYQLTTFRVDADYSDHRHPDNVQRTDSITEDLSRRDFTVNAIAYDPLTEQLVDPYQGQQDLAARLLRSVGDAQQRLTEDALRMLRACRFSAQLNFDLDLQLSSAIRELAPTIRKISQPRISEELSKLLLAPAVDRGIELLLTTNLAYFVFPELHKMQQLQQLQLQLLQQQLKTAPANLALRLVLIAHWANYNEVALVALCKRLQLANRHLNNAKVLLCQLNAALDLLHSSWTDAQIRKVLAVNPDGDLQLLTALLQHSNNTAPDKVAALQQDCRQQSLLLPPLRISDLTINGCFLQKRLQRPSGRWLGELLQELLDYVLQNPQHNQPEILLARSKSWLQCHGNDCSN